MLKTRITKNSTVKIFSYEYDYAGRKIKFKYSLNGNERTIASYKYDATGRMFQKLYSPSSAIGSNQTGLWTNNATWQGGSLPTLSDKVTINTGHTVAIPNGQTVSAGMLIDKGILQNFGTLQMGTLVGNITGTLQTVDYSYHIRGGLRGINLDASGNLTNKLFSLRLGYEGAGFYDGNIGKQEWKSSLDGLSRSYTYSYDKENRILGASYSGGKPNETYSLNSVTYDLNGNIKTLSRNGLKSNNTFGVVDNLVYTYQANSNKIQKVDDISNETASFTDVSGNDYTYSADGSLTSDANKGITLIEYNYLKLPKRIVKGGTTILYQYDASGKKLKETIGSQVTDYVGNKIYKNNVLYQLGHDEGRIINGEYEYNIKDHLGNLRVAFRDSLGIAKIVQANSYGIWGEDLPTLSYLKPLWKTDNFKFTGKEELPETGYTDFGARLYDNLVPRFITVDPSSEKYFEHSPFSYVMNNPISYIDPDGREIWINYGDGKKVRYENGKLYNEDGTKYKGQDKFVSSVTSILNQINTVEAGKKMISELSDSKNDFNFSNVDSGGGERTMSFQGNDKGGGTISAKALGLTGMMESQKVEVLAHELFHGYQFENGEKGPSVNKEVAAYLFGRSISFQVAMNNSLAFAQMPWGKSNPDGQNYDQAMSKLMYADKFDLKSYTKAINSFLNGAAVNSPTKTKPLGLYSNFVIKPNDTNPSIKRFYPLIR